MHPPPGYTFSGECVGGMEGVDNRASADRSAAIWSSYVPPTTVQYRGIYNNNNNVRPAAAGQRNISSETKSASRAGVSGRKCVCSSVRVKTHARGYNFPRSKCRPARRDSDRENSRIHSVARVPTSRSPPLVSLCRTNVILRPM